MPNNKQVQLTGDAALAARRDQARGEFVALVNQVPDSPPGDVADLLGPILAAGSWEDLDSTGGLPSSKTLIDVPLRLESITKSVSDKDTLSGYFLMCDGVNMDTGEPIRWSAGGAQAVAVMAKLYVLRSLPAKIVYKAVEIPGVGTAVNCRVLDVFTTVVDG